MASIISITIFLFLATGAAAFALQRRWIWIWVLVLIQIVAINVVWSLSRQIRIAHLRAVSAAECADAPKVVPYHDGMTLCPGQSTVVIVPVPLDPVPFGPVPDRGI